MPFEIKTQMEIDAPAERVWRTLVDFNAYPKWNPFIKKIEGTLAHGAQLSISIQPPGGKTLEFNPRIIALEEGVRLIWLGRILMPGLFDGEYRFEICPMTIDRVKFIHSERFSGLLSALILKMVGKETREGFHAMNEALKREIEVQKGVPTSIDCRE